MNKKIITIIGAAALLASSTHANPHIDSGLRDGIVGGIIGAIIGNNTGSGDSETGALIGAVTGISSGVLNRRSYSSGHRGHTQSVHHSHGHHIPVRPVYTTVYEQRWIPAIYSTPDYYGNVHLIRHGYYKTVSRRVRIR